MNIQPIFRTLHKHAPRLGKLTSLAVSSSTIAANSLISGAPLFTMGGAKMLTQAPFADKAIIGITKHWIHTNNLLIDQILPNKDWRIHLPDNLDEHKKYLLICNHQSWVDTSVIQYISENRLPLTRFFTKHELIYMPIVGQAFYLLDFPMMKRHSKEAIAKNPSLKDADIIEAKRACELLKSKPFTLLNYLEGTRFSPEKHSKQHSPYRHLLKPKAGGFALALAMLGKEIDGILDMTIVYPDGVPTYTDLWQGNLTRLGVDIRHINIGTDISSELFDSLILGHYFQNDTVKNHLYDWLDGIWKNKDTRIDEMLASFKSPQ